VAAVSSPADTLIGPADPGDGPPVMVERTVRAGTSGAGNDLMESDRHVGYTTAPVTEPGLPADRATVDAADRVVDELLAPAADDPGPSQDRQQGGYPELITLSKLHELRFMLKQVGVQDPDKAAVVSTLAGRDVDGPAVLSVAEGDLVLSRLGDLRSRPLSEQRAAVAHMTGRGQSAPGEGAEAGLGRRVQTTPDPSTVTQPQLRKMGALFGELGVKGEGSRADRIHVVSHLLGHPVGSSKELSAGEASQVIEDLGGLVARGAAGVAELESILRPGDEDAEEDGDGEDEDVSDELFPEPVGVEVEVPWRDQG
jgi:hypothetical protein